MADDLTARNPFIDLTIVTARTIRIASTARVKAIRVNGTVGVGTGDLILRETTATTGEVIFKLLGPSGSDHDGTISFPGEGRVFDGIFMDVIGIAWEAGSFMTIYTAEPI